MAKTSKGLGYKPSPRIAWRKVEDEAVLLNLDTSVYYSLNPVGCRVWELIEKKKDIPAIVAAIRSEYDVDEGRARKDVEKLLQSLLKKKLLVAA